MTETATTENKWFYEENGQRLGGIDEATMIALIQSRKLGYGSLVWQKGFGDWKNLEDTLLRTHLESISPPPLASKHISNSIIWILAFAPILGYLLELFLAGFVAGLAYSGNESHALRAAEDRNLIYISIALNILLAFWDERRLQKAGINTSRLKVWMWLAPVYLYQRAKTLKHNLIHFITWMTCVTLIILASASTDESIVGAHPQNKKNALIKDYQHTDSEELKRKAFEPINWDEISPEPYDHDH